jgi:hypothetical protein
MSRPSEINGTAFNTLKELDSAQISNLGPPTCGTHLIPPPYQTQGLFFLFRTRFGGSSQLVQLNHHISASLPPRQDHTSL